MSASTRGCVDRPVDRNILGNKLGVTTAVSLAEGAPIDQPIVCTDRRKDRFMRMHGKPLKRHWLLLPLLLVLLGIALASCSGGYSYPSNGSPSGTPSSSGPGY